MHLTQHPMASTLFIMLREYLGYDHLHDRDTFPNLRALHIDYHNRLPNDKHDVLFRFRYIPRTLTSLTMNYTYDARTPPWLIEGLRRATPSHKDLRKYTHQRSSIQNLAIFGASQETVIAMLRCCQAGLTLSTDVDLGNIQIDDYLYGLT
jgi:hypothetical protein